MLGHVQAAALSAAGDGGCHIENPVQPQERQGTHRERGWDPICILDHGATYIGMGFWQSARTKLLEHSPLPGKP